VEDANDSGLEDEDDPLYKLYEFVRSYKNANDLRLSDPFMRLPNRRFYPDYYDEIKRPTALSKIKSKIRSNQYTDLNEMLDELNIMFKNALKYNLSDSQIYKDALELQKACLNKAKEYTDYVPSDNISDLSEEDEQEKIPLQTTSKKFSPQSTTSNSSYKSKKLISNNLSTTEIKSDKKVKQEKLQPFSEVDVLLRRRFKQLYKCLFNYCDEDGKYPIELFMEKPSKKDYPDYYDIIKEPIDMKTIDANIKADRYSSPLFTKLRHTQADLDVLGVRAGRVVNGVREYLLNLLRYNLGDRVRDDGVLALGKISLAAGAAGGAGTGGARVIGKAGGAGGARVASKARVAVARKARVVVTRKARVAVARKARVVITRKARVAVAREA